MKYALGIVGILLIGFIFATGSLAAYGLSIYNGIKTKSQKVTYAWANVENQYQRRMDLIPNIVNAVQGAASFEKSTLIEIANARASVGRATIDINNVTPEQLKTFEAAQQGLAGVLSKLMVITERYPDLKTNTNFLELQAQLEGTENRISTARWDFNKDTMAFNNHISVAPNSFLANFFGYKEKPYFKADEKAKDAPKVEFNFNK